MAYVKNGVLAAGVVTTVTVDAGHEIVDVCNVNGAAAIYFTYGETTPADPDTSGTTDDNFCLPATICSLPIKANVYKATIIKLKSTGVPTFSATGIRPGVR